MRYTGSVCKLCRREGEKLYLKGARCESPKCPIAKGRPAPGQHGVASSSAKKTEFGKQLREKQKAKRIFGLNERTFKNYYVAAEQSKQVTGDELLRRIETRFDNVLYRAGIASSRPHARQIIRHGLMKLNKKKVSIPSQLLEVGDTFEVAENKREVPLLKQKSGNKPMHPRWLKVDTKNLTGEVIGMPDKEDFDQSIKRSLIVEFYSK